MEENAQYLPQEQNFVDAHDVICFQEVNQEMPQKQSETDEYYQAIICSDSQGSLCSRIGRRVSCSWI